jgi:hypothetical protein
LYSLLEKVMPRAVLKAVKATLLARGVLECDRVASPGKAFGYRLTAGYQDTRKLTCADDKLSRKIAVAYQAEERALQPVHRALLESLRRVKIDEARAEAIIGTLKPRPKKRKVPETVAQYRQRLREHAKAVAAGDHYLKCDRFGRVHTLLTSLKKDLLPCLYVEGEGGARVPLVALDLANSQPLFTALVAFRYYGGGKDARRRLLNTTFTEGAKDPYRGAQTRFGKAAAGRDRVCDSSSSAQRASHQYQTTNN